MKYFDIDRAMEYVGGYEKIFLKLRKSFLRKYKHFDVKIRKEYCKDKQEVYRLIHSLKGITLNLGAGPLYEACVKALAAINNDEKALDCFILVFNETYKEIYKYKKRPS